MIKTLLLCVFFSAALASANWTGKWLSIAEASAYPDQCDVPINNTVATLAVSSNGDLVLQAISSYTHKEKTWSLGWNTSTPHDYGSTCTGPNIGTYDCVSGYIFVEEGYGTWLNISWNKPGYRWCSALFVPYEPNGSDNDFFAAANGELALENEEGLDQNLFGATPWFFAIKDESVAKKELAFENEEVFDQDFFGATPWFFVIQDKSGDDKFLAN